MPTIGEYLLSFPRVIMPGLLSSAVALFGRAIKGRSLRFLMMPGEALSKEAFYL
jgi:hypothetical protein